NRRPPPALEKEHYIKEQASCQWHGVTILSTSDGLGHSSPRRELPQSKLLNSNPFNIQKFFESGPTPFIPKNIRLIPEKRLAQVKTLQKEGTSTRTLCGESAIIQQSYFRNQYGGFNHKDSEVFRSLWLIFNRYSLCGGELSSRG